MANEIYRVLGTTVTWGNVGTTSDEDLDLTTSDGDADGVCVGSYHDWGTGPQPDEFLVEIDIDGFDTPAVLGESVDVYLTESLDATLWTGPEAPSNTASTSGNVNRLANLHFVGSAIVRSSTGTAGDNLSAAFITRSVARYFAPVAHNNTADKLLSTSATHEIKVTPIYYQGQ